MKELLEKWSLGTVADRVGRRAPRRLPVPARRWALTPLASLFPALLAGGCELFERQAPVAPAESEVLGYFLHHDQIESVGITGNVVELTVVQPMDQLRRGGVTWAKVGPYVYLFSPATRRLFNEQPGVAAVRVVTMAPSGQEVARATLKRDTLSDYQWRRAQNLLGHVLQEGTARPRRLEQLVAWGEDHTEFAYDPAYVPE